MASEIRLKIYDTSVDGFTVSKLRLWRKNTRDTTEYIYSTLLDPFERDNYYQFLDQWIDDQNVQQTVWSGSNNGYYWNYVQDVESPNLIDIGQYAIKIDEPTIIGESSGSDGYLKLRVSGGYWEQYEFTLTTPSATEIVNTTGIFTGLSAGEHFLTVLDLGDGNSNATTPIVDLSIIIPEKKNYGVRYTNRFFTINGDSCTVNILRKGYTGDPEEICLAGDPLSISTDIIGDEFTSGLVPTDITLVVQQDYDGQYDDMFIMGADDWLLEVSVGDYLSIGATFMMEQTQVEHKDNPIYLSLNFMGGLSNMGDVKIENWRGAILLIDVIAAIQKIYNIQQYKIREFVYLREYTDPDDTLFATFGNYKVNAAMFNDKTPKEAIESLVNNFGCSLTLSSDNYLHIQRTALLRNVGDIITGTEYTPNGEALGQINMNVDPLLVLKSDTSDGYYVDNAQGYGRIPKVGKFSINCDFESVVDFKMSMDTNDYAVVSGALLDNVTEDAVTLQGALITSPLRTHKYRPHFSSGSFRLHGQGMRVELNIEHMISSSNPSTRSNLEGDSIQYLVMYGKNTCINKEGTIDNNIGYYHAMKSDKLNEWEDEKLEMTMNYDGDLPAQADILKVWLYGIWNSTQKEEGDGQANQLNIRSLTMEILLPENHKELNTPHVVDLDNKGIDLGELSMIIDDAPDNIGYSIEIGGVITKKNLALTSVWSEVTGSGQYPLRQMIAWDIIKLRSKNLKRLEGVLNTNYPATGKIIYDPSLAAGYFMIQRFTYTVKSNKLEFASVEIDPTDGNRLLEDGFYRNNEDGTNRKLQ